MTADFGFELLDTFGRQRRPCFFAFDFDLTQTLVSALDELDPAVALFDLNGVSNVPSVLSGSGLGSGSHQAPLVHLVQAPTYPDYRRAFAEIQRGFRQGYSYLANLTASSSITVSRPFDELFHLAGAPYRLWMPGLLVFSPETFIRIQNDQIRTFPMKGSLRCRLADRDVARQELLANPKELAEHVTVVDLLRNDLGRVAESVTVPRFRYMEEISLGEYCLLQTSSEITARLASGWQDRLGSLFREVLPAGSISGAPKRRTLEYIERAETLLNHRRGWYTGVFGVFDGESVDSAVMIRFMEQSGGQTVFKSGGGLTFDSRPQDEYRELCQKVTFPLVPCLFETIRVEEGCIVRGEYHVARMQKSAWQAWRRAPRFDPGQLIDQALELARQGLDRKFATLPGRWRLRLDYHPLGLIGCELVPYCLRRPLCLFIVDVADLAYRCKWADRSGLEALRQNVLALMDSGRVATVDGDWDLLLCRDGMILETSYAAVLVERAGRWRTPAQVMLPSTRLVALLDSSDGAAIEKAELMVADLPLISRLRLINAMIDPADAVDVHDFRDVRNLL